uniref:Uncharacterized protein n=1 Tax=Amphimedon queenslandica TaxID=400682 RepID=A0A1X7T7R5_AMPQE
MEADSVHMIMMHQEVTMLMNAMVPGGMGVVSVIVQILMVLISVKVMMMMLLLGKTGKDTIASSLHR